VEKIDGVKKQAVGQELAVLVGLRQFIFNKDDSGEFCAES